MTIISAEAHSRRESARHADGQFGTQARDEADVSLDGNRYFHELEHWAPTPMDFVPQANDLSKIVTVVDAIAEGVTSQSDLADALDMAPQGGNYYANAAEYLGLIEQDRTEKPYLLIATPLGQAFQNSDPETRTAMIAQMIPQIADVQTLRHHGGVDELRTEYMAAGLSDETAQRRIDMLRSWSNTVEDSRELAFALANESDETRVRAHASAEERERMRAERIEREQARLIAGRQVNVANRVCGSCFQTMPLTGVCDTCD